MSAISRLLFVPADFASPATCELVRGMRALLDDLRIHYEVDVFTWPCIRGGPDVPPTWEGTVQALRGALDRPCHILSASSATAMVVMALDGREAAGNAYVANDMGLPDATLLSLGLATMADVGIASTRMESGVALLRLLVNGLGPAGASQVEADVDLRYLERWVASWETLDLTKQAIDVQTRTLFLEPQGEHVAYPEGEARAMFQRLVPHTAIKEVPHWPRPQMEDAERGRGLARVVSEFIGEST